VSKLARWCDWLLPELINLDPMAASAYGLVLVDGQASSATTLRLAPVSTAPRSLRLPSISRTPPGSPDSSIRQPAWIQRRPGATLTLVSFRGSDISRASTRAPS